MPLRTAFAWVSIATAMAAQSNRPEGSISGIIQQIGGNTPVVGAYVRLSPGRKSAETDAAGRYEIKDLPASEYTVTVYSNREGLHGKKTVSLGSGQTLTIDFRLRPMAMLSGRIVDENNEPVPGAQVCLIAREYRLGALRYVYAALVEADDRGQYVLSKIEPGRGFLIEARKSVRTLSAISDAPTAVQLRKKAVLPTWYPENDSVDGAQTIVLHPGEDRENVDIRMMKSLSYCLDGALSSGNRPAPLSFWIEEQIPASGESGDGAVFVRPTAGIVGPDGKIRICDLHPGVYRLSAFQTPGSDSPRDAPLLGETDVVIGDKDLHNVAVVAKPRVPVSGETAWDGPSPDKPITKVGIGLDPIGRAPFGAEMQGLYVESAIPGHFKFPGLLVDDYSLHLTGIPDSAYVKDVAYGGVSALHEPIQIGKTMGSDLRVVLAHDGATISARVTDKDGNPVPDCSVVLLPANATTEAALADSLVRGQTDQYGAYISDQIAPGKYFALATNASIDRTPEMIAKLSRARLSAQELEIAPNARVQVSLSAVDLE